MRLIDWLWAVPLYVVCSWLYTIILIRILARLDKKEFSDNREVNKMTVLWSPLGFNLVVTLILAEILLRIIVSHFTEMLYKATEYVLKVADPVYRFFGI